MLELSRWTLRAKGVFSWCAERRKSQPMAKKILCLKALLFQVSLGLALLLMCTAPEAHQDRIFDLGSDGTISGVPDAYQPATLVLTRGDSGPVRAALLRLKNGEYRFPECLMRAFDGISKDGISLHGSWYHDLNSMPPYLSIELKKAVHRSGAFFSGYSLLFNLQTAELMQAREHVWTRDPDRLRTIPAFARLCGGKEPEISRKAKAGK